MAFNRPTLAEVRARVSSDLASRLGLSGLLPRSILLALANADAAAVHLLHGHLEYLARQQFPQTSDREGIIAWASLRGLTRKPATFAFGQTTFTGQEGATIPNATQLTRADGVKFKTRATVAISGGSATVLTLALTAGEIGNTPAQSELKLASSLVGIASVAIVEPPGLEFGVDAETDAELQARTLAAWRAPVRGGAQSDYVTWALEVAGVTRAWCTPNVVGIGTVGLSFAVDGAGYGPIPNAGDVALVLAYLLERRPVTAQLFVYAPIALPLDLTLSLVPNTAAVKTAVEASVADLLRRTSSPGGTLLLSQIQEAISLATGETDHTLTDPVADVVAGPGELLVPGSFTYL